MIEGGSIFKQPNEKEFEQVKQLIEDFWLDNEDMKPEQFKVLLDSGKLIAFGRLREHNEATELCTLGVAKDYRCKGYGKEMVKHLINWTKRDVYVVTVIPEFFSKLGFSFIGKYPLPIQKKLENCSANYDVGVPYRAMKWEKIQI